MIILFCANNSTRPKFTTSHQGDGVHLPEGCDWSQSISKQFIDGVIGRYYIRVQISYQSWFPAVSG